MKKTVFVTLMLVIVGSQAVHAGNSLSRAAIDGNMQAVQERVKNGEGVNDIDKWGWTALMWSVYYGNIPVAKWLLEQGADPNIKSEKDYGNFMSGTTALILAAAYGHDEAVAALLKKKADANVIDKKGRKAIDYAREYNFDKCVALLKGK